MATTLGNRRLKTTELFIEVDGSELDDIYSDPSIFWYHFMKLYSNYRLLPLNWAQYEDTGKIEFYGCDECCYKASITDIYRRDSVLRYREGISYGAGGENRRYTIYTIPMYVPTSIIPGITKKSMMYCFLPRPWQRFRRWLKRMMKLDMIQSITSVCL